METERSGDCTAQPTQTDSIAKLALALSKAQGAISGAVKDKKNTFFGDYADLESVWEACRSQLSQNELSVIQTTEASMVGVVVVTTLAHSSGEWIRGRLWIPTKDQDAQKFGSALTYARRYALAAMVGVAPAGDDDDGEGAGDSNAGNKTTSTQQQKSHPAGQTTKTKDSQSAKPDTSKKQVPTECPKCKNKTVYRHTVIKDGKNKGRLFESCSYKDNTGTQCEHFNWVKVDEKGTTTEENQNTERKAAAEHLKMLMNELFDRKDDGALWLLNYGTTGTIVGLDDDGLSLAVKAASALLDKKAAEEADNNV